jgi:hypothetical protein
MDALGEYVARRGRLWTLILTIIASLIAVVVEISIISRVWINPVQGHNGFRYCLIPVLSALPLFLCLSIQVGVRKALRSGEMSSKIADTIEVVAGILILTTYQAIGELMRLIP